MERQYDDIVEVAERVRRPPRLLFLPLGEALSEAWAPHPQPPPGLLGLHCNLRPRPNHSCRRLVHPSPDRFAHLLCQWRTATYTPVTLLLSVMPKSAWTTMQTMNDRDTYSMRLHFF
jgi:hypothetical protein